MFKIYLFLWLLLLLNEIDVEASVKDEEIARFQMEQTLLSKCPLAPYLKSPVIANNETMNISLTLTVNRFFDLDEVTESFLITGMVQANWALPCVAELYNPGGWPREITDVSLDPDRFWWPSISHRNTLSETILNFKSERNLQLNVVSGQFMGAWVGRWESTCDFDMFKYPFDKQYCYIRIFSLDLDQYLHISKADLIILPNFGGSNWNWKLNKYNSSTYNEIFFGTQNFSTALFEFHFERIPTYILLALFFPAFMLEFLAVCTFFLPLDSSDRTVYIVTILLAFYFLQTQFLDMTPKSPKPCILNYQMVFMLAMATWIAIYSSILCFIAYKKPELNKKQIEICGKSVNYLFFIDICLSSFPLIIAGCASWILFTYLFV